MHYQHLSQARKCLFNDVTRLRVDPAAAPIAERGQLPYTPIMSVLSPLFPWEARDRIFETSDTPRFATAHLTTHNKAINGTYKRFTNLDDETLFLDYNTQGILAYKRASDALLKILPLGISHPVTAELLEVVKTALIDVIASNNALYTQLDTERFFNCVRPYYKPYRVGKEVYRGANAGDFAGINVIDMLLGLCSANEPSYSHRLLMSSTWTKWFTSWRVPLPTSLVIL